MRKSRMVPQKEFSRETTQLFLQVQSQVMHKTINDSRPCCRGFYRWGFRREATSADYFVCSTAIRHIAGWQTFAPWSTCYYCGFIFIGQQTWLFRWRLLYGLDSRTIQFKGNLTLKKQEYYFYTGIVNICMPNLNTC